jgi:hypothetical protein
MLVALFNAVKVESVPLNSNYFCRRCFSRLIRTYDRSVGDLASIGYNGQPARNPFRVVRPPITVLIDLTVLFPREPHRTGRFQPNGLQLHKVVEGQLTCWGICEQGDWWGLVTYPIAYGSKRKTVTHWVPAWTLRRNDAGSGRAR